MSASASAYRRGRAGGMPHLGREMSAHMYVRLAEHDQDFPHEELKCVL
ncbi:hypothetical protein [Streptomyces vinaceus]